MVEIQHVIELVQNTPSYLSKQNILRNHRGTEGLLEILQFIYNPYYKTGISHSKLTKALEMSYSFAPKEMYTYKYIIKYLKAHNTGSETDLVQVAQFIANNTATLDLACAIVTQDLKMGFSSTSLNKIFGVDFIPKIGCMLGTNYDMVKPESVQWPCIVTEKLDGIRRIAIKENGSTRFFSRSGHEDVGLYEISKEIKELPDNYVYDGELLAAGTHKDNIALRQATNSLSSSKGKKTGLIYNIFDMVPLDEFYAGRSKQSALIRKLRLGATLMDESIALLPCEQHSARELINAFGIHTTLVHIKAVPILGFIKTFDEVGPIVEAIWAAGGEGVMLNTHGSPYEIKRSKSLLKVKEVKEIALSIIGFTEGKDSFEGMLGSFIVDYKGVPVGVGSGLSIPGRIAAWGHQDNLLGKQIEIEYFGESTNVAGTKSLNCPIFKRFVGGE